MTGVYKLNTKKTITKHISNQLDFYYYFLLGLAFSILSILKYESLHSSYYDLGFYESLIINFIRNKSWVYLFNTHANLFVPFYSLFYGFVPTPCTLLVIQSFSIAFSGYFLSKIFLLKTNLSKYWFLIIFSLYSPVWYSCLIGFHFEHLSVLFLSFFYFIFEKKFKSKRFLIFIISLSICMVKEVYALSVIMIGIYVALKHKWYLFGTFISLFALLYFILVTQVLIPFYSFGNDPIFVWNNAFKYLGTSIIDISKNLILHPEVIIIEFFSDYKKLQYLVFLFAPLLFLPFISPLELLPILPIILISILSHNQNHYSIINQYATSAIAPIFIGFITSINKTETIYHRIFNNSKTKLIVTDFKFILIAIVIFSSVLFNIIISPSPISRLFWTKKIWNLHFSSYIPSLRDLEIKKAIEHYIPKDPTVIVTTQNSLNHSILANRKYYFSFPEGAINPAKTLTGQKVSADYLLIDRKRPLYIKDKGCDYIYSECKNTSIINEFNKLLEDAQKKYKIIYSVDDFQILKLNDN